jgi:hypothetical protein
MAPKEDAVVASQSSAAVEAPQDILEKKKKEKKRKSVAPEVEEVSVFFFCIHYLMNSLAHKQKSEIRRVGGS